MSTKTTTHLLLVPLPAWGHVRPICHLALRLLDCREDIVVTILTAPYSFSRAQDEISKYMPDNLEVKPRIRVLTTFKAADQDVFKEMSIFMESYPTAYKTLKEEKEITCSTTGITYQPMSAPVAVILDFFMAPLLFATRALTGKSVPIIAWTSGGASSIIRTWGPEDIGGMGDLNARVEAEVKRSGGDPDEIGNQLYRKTTGVVLNIPGLPLMYDHELFPQRPPPTSKTVFPLLKGGYIFLKNCDAVIVAAGRALEAEGIEGIQTWFQKEEKDVYAVGPLLPRTYWSGEQTDDGATDVRIFLDDMLGKHGEKSVILVSFGSFFWPPASEYVDELIEALIEKEVPFILCHPSPFANISPELSARIKSTGKGLLCKWAPQHYVLAHLATGWFLTHGGQGSVTEALGQGVPLICWPIQGDQPSTSAHLSVNLRVAFELIEVRTGSGLKPLHRLQGRAPEGTREAVAREIREVLDSARGEAGQEMRKNAEKIKAEFKKSWDVDGIATKELRMFVDKLARS